LRLVRQRVVELFVARTRLALREVDAAAGPVAPERGAFEAALQSSLSEFLAQEPIEFRREVHGGWRGALVGPGDNLALPLQSDSSPPIVKERLEGTVVHPTHRRWLATDAWRRLSVEHLDDAVRGALDEAFARRERVWVADLAALMEERLAFGLALAKSERATLRPVLVGLAAELATDTLDIAHISAWRSPFEAPFADPLFERLRLGSRVELSQVRRGQLAALVGQRRRVEHDVACEIEFFCVTYGGGDEARALLTGLGKTLIARDLVAQKRSSVNGPLAPVTRLGDIERWALGVRGVLGVDDQSELEAPPSRSLDALVAARIEFLLAAIDEVALLSAAQVDRLRPLVERFVGLEKYGAADLDLFGLELPRVLGLRFDGWLEPSVPGAEPAPPEVLEVIADVHGLLTAAQKELALR